MGGWGGGGGWGGVLITSLWTFTSFHSSFHSFICSFIHVHIFLQSLIHPLIHSFIQPSKPRAQPSKPRANPSRACTTEVIYARVQTRQIPRVQPRLRPLIEGSGVENPKPVKGINLGGLGLASECKAGDPPLRHMTRGAQPWCGQKQFSICLC